MTATLRLLLVEDDAEDALLFQRRCPPHFRIRHVTALEPALLAMREETCDLCFADYRLGAETALDLVRRARAEGLRMPIVVMTGQDLESLGENALLAGATDFTPKDGLDSVTIQRLARWALIRRHVENRREDVLAEQAIAQLMSRPPPLQSAAANAVLSAPLRRVLYLSRSRRALLQNELLPMCAGFAAANARTDVTGVLVYSGQSFLQVIEGEQQAVGVLLRRIESDDRHGSMTVMIDEPVSARLFADWNMGLLQLGRLPELSAAQWMNLRQRSGRLMEEGLNRESLERLIRALPGLLAGAAVELC